MKFRFITLKVFLVKIIWKFSYFIPDRYFLINFSGGRVYLNLKESPMMIARALGVYEPWKFNLFFALVKRDMTVIDIGANKGCFSLLAAKLSDDSGRVLSFEPEPINCSWITRSINKNNYKSITLFQMALSDSDGMSDLYLGKKSGFHSLIQTSDNLEGKKIPIMQKRLDTILEESGISKVDLIKIDVEGSELHVLRGALETIHKNDNLRIILDLHPKKGVNISEICDFLQNHGFKLFTIGEKVLPYTKFKKDIKELFAIKETF